MEEEVPSNNKNTFIFMNGKLKTINDKGEIVELEEKDIPSELKTELANSSVDERANNQFNQIVDQLCVTYQFLSQNCQNALAEATAFDSLLVRMDMLVKSLTPEDINKSAILSLAVTLRNDYQLHCNALHISAWKQFISMKICQKTIQLAIMKTKDKIVKQSPDKKIKEEVVRKLIESIENEYNEEADALMEVSQKLFNRNYAMQIIIQDDISSLENQLLFVVNNSKNWSKYGLDEVIKYSLNDKLNEALKEALNKTTDDKEVDSKKVSDAINNYSDQLIEYFQLINNISDSEINKIKKAVEEEVEKDMKNEGKESQDNPEISGGGQSGGFLIIPLAFVSVLALSQLYSPVAGNALSPVSALRSPVSSPSQLPVVPTDARTYFSTEQQVSVENSGQGTNAESLIQLYDSKQEITYHRTTVTSLTSDLEENFFYVALGTALGTAAADKKTASSKVVVFEIINYKPEENSIFTIFNFGKEKEEKYAVPAYTVTIAANGEITVVDGAPNDGELTVPKKIEEGKDSTMKKEKFVKKYLIDYVKQLKSIDPNTVDGVDAANAAFEQLKENKLLTLLKPETRGKIMGDAIIKLQNKGINITPEQKIELVQSLDIFDDKDDVNKYNADAVLGLSYLSIIRESDTRAALIKYAIENDISSEVFIAPLQQSVYYNYQVYLVSKTLQSQDIILVTDLEELRKHKKLEVLDLFISDLLDEMTTNENYENFITDAIKGKVINQYELKEQYEKYLDNSDESLSKEQKVVYEELNGVLETTVDELLTKQRVTFQEIQKEGIENMNMIQKKMVEYLNVILNPSETTTMSTVISGWIWNTQGVTEVSNKEMEETTQQLWKIRGQNILREFQEQKQIAGPEESNMLDAPDPEYAEKVVIKTISPNLEIDAANEPHEITKMLTDMIELNGRAAPRVDYETKDGKAILKLVNHQGYYLQTELLDTIKKIINSKKIDIKKNIEDIESTVGNTVALQLDNPNIVIEEVEEYAGLEQGIQASIKSLSDTYLLLSYFDKILDTSLTVMNKYKGILTHTQLDKLPNFSQEISPNAMLTSTENYQNALSLLNNEVEKIMGAASPETDIRDLIKQMSTTLNKIKSEEVQANKDRILESLRVVLENTKNFNKVQESLTLEKWRAFFAEYFLMVDGGLLAFWESNFGKISIVVAATLMFATIAASIIYYKQMIETGWYILKIGGSAGVSGAVYYILVYYADPSIANWALTLAIGSGAMSFYMAGLISTSGNAATITSNSNVSQNIQTQPAIDDSNSSNASDNASGIASGNTSGNASGNDEYPWIPPTDDTAVINRITVNANLGIQPNGGKKQSRKIKKQNKSKKTTIRKRSRKMRRGVKTRQRRGNKSKTRKRYNSYKRKSKK